MHPYSVIVALGCLPPAPLLNHISTITSPAPTTSTSYSTTPMVTKVTTVSKADDSLETPHAVFIGQGLPLVPKKLASKIGSVEFVDMSELMSDCLGYSKTSTSEDKSWATKSKKRAVANILEWIQCFSIYSSEKP